MEARQAWAEFWAAPAGASGCLPAGADAIGAVQARVWTDFARPLGRGARVMDLASGDGRVLRMLARARRDLKLEGCDAAPVLPPAPPGTKMHAGVAMEELPFAPGRFATVTSQFGYEYGDTARIALEIARVLAPGGQAGLLLHRGDGPILAQNRTRRTQLHWALEERGLAQLAQAHTTLALPKGAPPAALQAAVGEAAAAFGPRSLAWEIAEALRRAALSHDAAAIAAITRKVAGETARIDDLQRACDAADRLDILAAQWTAAGLQLDQIEDIGLGPGHPPFARFAVLRR